eukprot:m.3730 g.3730  ORF g.3730 m.3730 type:complete len:1734 (+) comp9731_c0_seq2:710-5911(+)
MDPMKLLFFSVALSLLAEGTAFIPRKNHNDNRPKNNGTDNKKAPMPKQFDVIQETNSGTTVADFLGKQTNIIHGFTPSIVPTDGLKLVCDGSDCDVQGTTEAASLPGFENYVELVFCADTKALFEAAFELWTVESNFSAGAMNKQPNDEDSWYYETMAVVLGILPQHFELTNDYGFVLSRIRKMSLEQTFTNVDFGSAISDAASGLSGDSSQEFLDFFSEYGSHYVSKIITGDLFFQVFVYEREVYEDIIERYNVDNILYTHGPFVSNYQVHTAPRECTEVGCSGYTLFQGNLQAASSDSALSEIRNILVDDLFAEGPSCLELMSVSKREEVNDLLTKEDAVYVTLTSLRGLLSSENVTAMWDSLLGTGILQKYGPAAGYQLQSPTPPKVDETYSSFTYDIVSRIATSHMTFAQQYVNLKDVADEIIDPEFVDTVFIFADIVQFDGTIDFPGFNHIYIVCNEMFSYSKNSATPAKLVVGRHSTSEPEFLLFAQRHSGSFQLQVVPTQKTYTFFEQYPVETVDDPISVGETTVRIVVEKMPVNPTCQAEPRFYDRSSTYPPEMWLADNFVYGMHSLIVALETVMRCGSSESDILLAQQCALWIVRTLNESHQYDENCLDAELQELYSRALVLVKTTFGKMARSLLSVPYLSVDKLKEQFYVLLDESKLYEEKMAEVSGQITQHKLQQEIIENLEQLNENVQSTGYFLIDMLKSQASMEAALIGQLTLMQSDLNISMIGKVNELAALTDELILVQDLATTAADNLVTAIEEALEAEEWINVINGALAAGNLFKGQINIDYASTYLVISRMYVAVHECLQVLEGLEEMMNALSADVPADIDSMNGVWGVLDNFTSSTDEFPSVYDWTDYDIEVIALLGIIPGEVDKGARHDFETSAKQLSNRGKQYLDLANDVSNLQYEYMKLEYQKKVSEENIRRFEQLETQLDYGELPNTEKEYPLDLLSFGNQLMQRSNNIRMQLVDLFVTMDAAIRYYSLQPYTSLPNYDLLSIVSAMSEQKTKEINAFEHFNPKPENLPVNYVIENVPVDQLINGTFVHSIPLSYLPLSDLRRVRIVIGHVFVDGIKSTSTGTAKVQFVGSGRLLLDRDLVFEILNFTTVDQYYITYYDLATREPLNDPGEFAEDFAQLTPFISWNFKLPLNAWQNADLEFYPDHEVNTTLTMVFTINAIQSWTSVRKEKLETKPRISSLDNRKNHSDKKLKNIDVDSPVTTSRTYTKEELVAVMKDMSVVGDWDVIFAASALRINQLWDIKYHNDDEIIHIIDIHEISGDNMGNISQTLRLFGKVGPPYLQFVLHEADKAFLRMKMYEAQVEVRFYDKNTGEELIIPGIIEPYNVTLSEGALVAKLNLIAIKGEVTDEMDVRLDWSDSAFDTGLIFVNFTETVETEMELALAVYFKEHVVPAGYVLGTLKVDTANLPPEVCPKNFYFKTGGFGDDVENDLGCIYLFIRTDSPGSIADETTSRSFNVINMDHQIIPTGYDAALFLSARILMKDIVFPQVNPKVDNDLKVVDTAAVYPAFSIVSNVPAGQRSIMGKSDCTNNDPPLCLNLGVPTASFLVKGYGHELQFKWSESWKEKFTFEKLWCHSWCEYICTWNEPTCSFGVDNKIVATIHPDTHVVSFPSLSGNLDMNCPSSDPLYGKDELVNAMEGININLDDLSLFAVSNLLFPEGQVLRMEYVAIPGDLLALGQINLDHTESSVTAEAVRKRKMERQLAKADLDEC